MSERMSELAQECSICAQLQRCWGGDRVWMARKLLRPAPPETEVEDILCRCPECSAIYAFTRIQDGMHLDESLEQLTWLGALALVEPNERAQMLANRERQIAQWQAQLAHGSAWQVQEAARNLADLACGEADWATVARLLAHPNRAVATLAAEMLHRQRRWRTAPPSIIKALAGVESRSARFIETATEFLRVGMADIQSGDPGRYSARLADLARCVSWLSDAERAQLAPLLAHAHAALRVGVADALSWNPDPPGPLLTAALRALRELPADMAASVRLILARLR